MSLFDNEHRYTESALAIEREVYAKIKATFNKYVAQGFSPRELAYIVGQLGNDLALSAILDQRCKNAKPLCKKEG